MTTKLMTVPRSPARKGKTNADPLVAMVAEQDAMATAGAAMRNIADEIYYALPKEERRQSLDVRDEGDLPGSLGALYRKAMRLEARADRLHRKIVRTKPVSIAGACAALEMMNEYWREEAIDNVIAGLREIEGAQSAPERAAA
jgi:hypothetical protein